MKTPGELFDLTGKVAVVTGGSSGIGRAVAEGLATAGADVVVASRKLEAWLRELVAERDLAYAVRLLPPGGSIVFAHDPGAGADKAVASARTPE